MVNLLYHFLEETANKYPDKKAVITASKTLTYAILNEDSDRVRNYLQEIGVKKGDRVGIYLGNTPNVAISFWGIIKAGAIAIPLAAGLKRDKLKYIINDSGMSVLFTKSSLIEENGIDLGAEDTLKKVIICDTSKTKSKGKRFDTLENVLLYDTVSQQKELISVDLCSIIYTSGSTGEPKGVMHTHLSMVTATNSLNSYLNYSIEDTVLCALPLTFDYGLYQMIMSASTGATLLLELEFTWPIFLLKKIAAHNVTIFPIVPTMLMMVYDQAKKKQFDLSSVRAITNTGAALTVNNIQMSKELFPGAQIFSMYGLTECKRCTYLPPAEIDSKPNSVGIAIPNTELWLVDENNQRIEEPNIVGQLIIRGATIMKGYWNKPEKTAEKLKEGPITGELVFYTGDYCYLDEDGYLYFQGRMDNIIKTKGMKVSPKEVEDCIYQLEAVQSCSIVGIPHPTFGESLVAFVTIKESSMITKKEIIDCCHKHLEPYKIPTSVEIVDQIPRTANGKFDSLRLRESVLKKKVSNEIDTLSE